MISRLLLTWARSSRGGEAVVDSRGRNWYAPEEALGFRYRGLLGIVILVPAGLVTLLSRPVISEGSGLNLACGLAAWAAFITGATFRIWATLYVGSRKRSTLVTEGPYSLCRNPLYIGAFLVALSAGLFLKSILFTAAVCLVALAYTWVTVPAEESVLQATHGAAYSQYCRRINRFWPRLSSFHTADVVEVKVHGLRLEFRRLLAWVWLPFLCEVIAHARSATWWPTVFNLP